MDKIVKQGRILFAIALVAFGVENLILVRFDPATAPVIPWVPGPFLTCLTGLALLAAGLSIAAGIKARLAAILSGILFLLCVLLLQISRVAALPFDVGVRTCAFETLAMCGSAFTLAGTLPAQGPFSPRWENAVKFLIDSGRFLFAASSVVFGVDHFLVLGLIVSLVPVWIPGSGLFWAYFTGLAFIAAGLSIATKWMARWAGALLGAMFLLWFLLLHAPRIVSFPRSHDPDEWSSAFIALGMCGGSWICAWAFSRKAPPGTDAARESGGEPASIPA
jgi:hypothetical protein